MSCMYVQLIIQQLLMKSIWIGDIHTREDWKYIVQKENDADEYGFIGDYFDTFDNVSAAQQIYNFNAILKFKEDKEKEGKKVILLCGNHDYHYLPGIDEQYSGFQYDKRYDIGHVINAAFNNDLIQMCYYRDGIWFSHAGIGKTFLFNHGLEPTMASINEKFKHHPKSFGFQQQSRIYSDPYGDDIFQSPIWIRPRSLSEDRIDGIQVVGHTQQKRMKCLKDIWFIDCLGTSGHYLKIIDGEFIPVKSYS